MTDGSPMDETFPISGDEFRILEGYRTETVLLKYARKLREHMHNCKFNILRLSIWSDLTAAANEAARLNAATAQREREAIEKIYVKLPVDAGPILPRGMGGPNLRLRLAHSNRHWKESDSIRLRETVIQSLITEYVLMTTEEAEKEGRLTPDSRDSFRKETRAALLQTEHNSRSAAWVRNLFAKVEETLSRRSVTNDKLDPKSFWGNFWDRVALDLSAGSSIVRSARECQGHWVHYHSPDAARKVPWTKEEETKLISLASNASDPDWREIAKLIGNGRTVFDTYHHYQTALNTRLTTSEWTPEQEELLKRLVERYRGERSRIWFKVSSHFSNKSNEQCRSKYEKGLKEVAVRQGQWLCEEDLRLQILVSYFGRGSWRRVAEHMPQRTDIKCRERYENLLAPELNKAKWTDEECAKLLRVVKELGPGQWSRVQEYMPGRTDSECAKQWARLDPLGALHEGALRAVRCIFIPNQQRQRNNRPAVEERDFELKISSHLTHLLKNSLALTPSGDPRFVSRRSARLGTGGLWLTAHERAKRGRLMPPQFSSDGRPRLTLQFPSLGDQPQDGLADVSASMTPSEASHTSKNSSWGGEENYLTGGLRHFTEEDIRDAKQISFLKCYLDNLSTGSAEADVQLNQIRKMLVRRREQYFSLPQGVADLVPLTPLEESVVKAFAQEQRDFDDLKAVEWKGGEIMPGVFEYAGEPRQRVLRMLATEIFRGSHDTLPRSPFPEAISSGSLADIQTWQTSDASSSRFSRQMASATSSEPYSRALDVPFLSIKQGSPDRQGEASSASSSTDRAQALHKAEESPLEPPTKRNRNSSGSAWS